MIGSENNKFCIMKQIVISFLHPVRGPCPKKQYSQFRRCKKFREFIEGVSELLQENQSFSNDSDGTRYLDYWWITARKLKVNV